MSRPRNPHFWRAVAGHVKATRTLGPGAFATPGSPGADHPEPWNRVPTEVVLTGLAASAGFGSIPRVGRFVRGRLAARDAARDAAGIPIRPSLSWEELNPLQRFGRVVQGTATALYSPLDRPRLSNFRDTAEARRLAQVVQQRAQRRAGMPPGAVGNPGQGGAIPGDPQHGAGPTPPRTPTMTQPGNSRYHLRGDGTIVDKLTGNIYPNAQALPRRTTPPAAPPHVNPPKPAGDPFHDIPGGNAGRAIEEAIARIGRSLRGVKAAPPVRVLTAHEAHLADEAARVARQARRARMARGALDTARRVAESPVGRVGGKLLRLGGDVAFVASGIHDSLYGGDYRDWASPVGAYGAVPGLNIPAKDLPAIPYPGHIEMGRRALNYLRARTSPPPSRDEFAQHLGTKATRTLGAGAFVKPAARSKPFFRANPHGGWNAGDYHIHLPKTDPEGHPRLGLTIPSSGILHLRQGEPTLTFYGPGGEVFATPPYLRKSPLFYPKHRQEEPLFSFGPALMVYPELSAGVGPMPNIRPLVKRLQEQPNEEDLNNGILAGAGTLVAGRYLQHRRNLKLGKEQSWGPKYDLGPREAGRAFGRMITRGFRDQPTRTPRTGNPEHGGAVPGDPQHGADYGAHIGYDAPVAPRIPVSQVLQDARPAESLLARVGKLIRKSPMKSDLGPFGMEWNPFDAGVFEKSLNTGEPGLMVRGRPVRWHGSRGRWDPQACGMKAAPAGRWKYDPAQFGYVHTVTGEFQRRRPIQTGGPSVLPKSPARPAPAAPRYHLMADGQIVDAGTGEVVGAVKPPELRLPQDTVLGPGGRLIDPTKEPLDYRKLPLGDPRRTQGTAGWVRRGRVLPSVDDPVYETRAAAARRVLQARGTAPERTLPPHEAFPAQVMREAPPGAATEILSRLTRMLRSPFKATLTAHARGRLPASAFALPGRRYPLNDPAHCRAALAMVSRFGTPEEQRRVRLAVAQHCGMGGAS